MIKGGYVLGAAAELKELATVGEDDERHLGITKNGQLISFLQQPIPPLGKCYLSIYLVLYPLQLYLPPSHLSFTVFLFFLWYFL